MSAQFSGESDSECLVAAGFLASLHDVVSCEVWRRNGTMLANVSVGSSSLLSAGDVQSACQKELEPHLVPQLVLLSRVKQLLQVA